MVFLARIVIPFSFSRSPESMTRSATSPCVLKAPVWRSMASTIVVLPWSTWATMATLRRSERRVSVEVMGVLSGSTSKGWRHTTTAAPVRLYAQGPPWTGGPVGPSGQ